MRSINKRKTDVHETTHVFRLGGSSNGVIIESWNSFGFNSANFSMTSLKHSVTLSPVCSEHSSTFLKINMKAICSTLADISISGQSIDLQYSTVSSKETFLADSRS